MIFWGWGGWKGSDYQMLYSERGKVQITNNTQTHTPDVIGPIILKWVQSKIAKFTGSEPKIL